jgi:hypothetical protein
MLYSWASLIAYVKSDPHFEKHFKSARSHSVPFRNMTVQVPLTMEALRRGDCPTSGNGSSKRESLLCSKLLPIVSPDPMFFLRQYLEVQSHPLEEYMEVEGTISLGRPRCSFQAKHLHLLECGF